MPREGTKDLLTTRRRIFYVVARQFEDLSNCYTKDEIDTALENNPRTMEDMYKFKLTKVVAKDRQRLANVFRWISHSMKPLSLEEVAAAPGVDLPDLNDLFKLCPSGMIRIDGGQPDEEGAGTMSIRHPSVHRFLHFTDIAVGNLSLFFLSDNAVQLSITKDLLDYLASFDQMQPTESIVESKVFLRYAASNWIKHMRECQTAFDNDLDAKKMLKWLFGSPMRVAFLNWMGLANPEDNDRNLDLSMDLCPSPLYIAILLGLHDLARDLIDAKSYINSCGGKQGTPLQLAATLGSGDLAYQLIDAGASVDDSTNNQPSVLSSAVSRGDTKLVETVLNAGGAIKGSVAVFGTVLHLASYRGFTDIVRSLLLHGAEVDRKKGIFGTALQAASAAGHADIVELLLHNNADPNARSSALGTPTQAAITGGYPHIVDMLVMRGARIDRNSNVIWAKAFEKYSLSSGDILLGAGDRLSKILRREIPKDLPSGLKEKQKLMATFLRLWDTASHKLKDPRRKNTAATVLLGSALEEAPSGFDSEHFWYKSYFWALFVLSQWTYIDVRAIS